MRKEEEFRVLISQLDFQKSKKPIRFRDRVQKLFGSSWGLGIKGTRQKTKT
jgi:hypothetical protein